MRGMLSFIVREPVGVYAACALQHAHAHVHGMPELTPAHS